MIKFECGSAITVLNAIGSGIGSTLGISTLNKVIIENADSMEFIINQKNADDFLIKQCIDTFEKKFRLSIEPAKITTNTQLPPKKGMKTSSTVSTLLILALAKFTNIEMSNYEAMLLGAEASVIAKVSITGAFDDAYTSLNGGFVITNNYKKQVLFKSIIPSNILKKEISLLIPENSNPKDELLNLSEFVDTSVLSQSLKEAYARNIERAIDLNTSAYAQYLLKDPKIINDLKTDTKSIVGLNGAGPSLFIIHESDLSEEIERTINNQYHEYQLVRSRFRKLIKP